MADNRDNRMACPECGGTWRVKGRSKERERYYRICSSCGHKGTTGRNGEPPEPKKLASLPCPKCHAPVWQRRGGDKAGNTAYHVCHTCGYKGTTDRTTGKEIPKRGEWYRCPDCQGVTRLTKHRFTWEERACEDCGAKCVREKKQTEVHRYDEWAAANPHRLPRELRPAKILSPEAVAAKQAKADAKAAKAAAFNLERARNKVAKQEAKRKKAEVKAVQQRMVARARAVAHDEKKSRELRDHVDHLISAQQAKNRDARRKLEDRRLERQLFGTDPY